MRYADAPGARCEIHAAATPASVWRLVTDIGLPARLSAELQSAEWLDGATGPAVGAAFVGHNRHRMIGEWQTVSYVTELEEPRIFRWAVVDPDGRFGDVVPDPRKPLATWSFELTPEGGGTRLAQTVVIGPAPSGLSRAIGQAPEREEELVAARLDQLRANIDSTLLGIKALAEGTT